MSSTAPDPWPLKDTTQRVIADPRLVVPFVGAGVAAGTGLPSAVGLAKRLREEHPLAVGSTFPNPTDLRDVADVLAAGAPEGRGRVIEFLLELFDIDKHEHLPTTTVRNLINTPSKWYLTTNYDLLPEKAAADARIPHRSFTWKNLPELVQVPRDVEHELYIVHLHGSVDDPGTFILDSEQYRSIQNNKDVADFLLLLFTNFNVCFIGTSLDEPYLQSFMESWRGSAVRHVLIGDEDTIKKARRGRNAIRAAAHAVETDAFPNCQWHLLDEFTRNLVERPASSAAPLLRSVPTGPPLGSTTGALRSRVTGTPAPAVHYVRSDWGPEWTRRALEDLARSNESEAYELQMVLGGAAGPGVIRKLITNPPDWLANGSFRLWTAVARFAEQQGDWKLAARAWETTAKCVDADVAGFLVSAAVAAELDGQNSERDRLMAEARTLDSDHPRVRLQDIPHDATPEEQLALLKPLWDEPGDVGLIAHSAAALACLLLENLDGAEWHLQEVKRQRPDLIQARIVELNVLIQRYRMALTEAKRIDARVLERAKNDCLALRDELAAMRRWGESVRLLMLAADATALQWSFEEAGALLLTATEEEKATPGGRTVLAEAALRAQQAETALKLAEGAPENDVAILRASAHLHVGDAQAQERAWHKLEEIAADPTADRVRAALVLVLAAPQLAANKAIPDLPWPDDAEQLLRGNGLEEPAVLSRVMWLHSIGEKAEAQALLRPHLQNLKAAEVQLQLALADKDNDAAGEAASNLLELGPDNLTRLKCAEALLEMGDVTRAKSEAVAVADDGAASGHEQGYAQFLLTKIATEQERAFKEALEHAERWAEVEPDNERHVWARVLALTQLTRHAEALRLLDDTHVAPLTMGDARLAAVVYARMPDRDEALRRMKDVIDRAPEPDEELERQFQFLVLMRGGGRELPEDIAAAMKPIDANTAGVQQVSFAELKQLSLQRQARDEPVLKDIADGITPSMALAAMRKTDIGSTWARFRAMPYGFGNLEVAFQEVAAARAALLLGFVAEPTALFTAELLEDDAGDVVRQVLRERGRITQSALHDVDMGVSALLSETEEMTRTEVVLDASSGELVPVEWPKEQVERDHQRAHRMLELAQELAAERDPMASDGRQLDLLFDISAPTAMRVMVSTPGVARRVGLPVLSDDRRYRLLLQQLGIPAFGTSALLDALVYRGDLTREAMRDARTALRARGYMGLLADAEEIAALLDASKGEPSDELLRVFGDPTTWQNGYLPQVRLALDALGHIAAHYPEKLVPWARRILSAAASTIPFAHGAPKFLRVSMAERLGWHAEWFLTIAWAATPWNQPATRDFYARLTPALRQACDELGFSIDPLPGAVERYVQFHELKGLGRTMPVILLCLLPFEDLMAILHVHSPWWSAADRFEHQVLLLLQDATLARPEHRRPALPQAKLSRQQRRHPRRRR